MVERYKILWEGGTGEIVEKKSRFIADTKPVESEEEALEFIESVRKKYWDARHHCFAYCVGDKNQVVRCSDDGEPSQTAGRPMLDVLLGEELHDVCVVVTRYFGGTLLGTGGLVRAYSEAAREGIRNSRVLEKCLGRRMGIDTDYTGIGKIQYILAQRQITVLHTEYTDKVRLEVMVPSGEAKGLEAEITEGTSGRAAVDEGELVYYGVADKEIVVF
ncbi:MAG: YigZ family protein [Hungatella sp.]|mgnify:CR=1 FL=1|jgi:uncharacterized YigZ family protein|nr:YigZ family protein [Hungatella sp.]